MREGNETQKKIFNSIGTEKKESNINGNPQKGSAGDVFRRLNGKDGNIGRLVNEQPRLENRLSDPKTDVLDDGEQDSPSLDKTMRSMTSVDSWRQVKFISQLTINLEEMQQSKITLMLTPDLRSTISRGRGSQFSRANELYLPLGSPMRAGSSSPGRQVFVGLPELISLKDPHIGYPSPMASTDSKLSNPVVIKIPKSGSENTRPVVSILEENLVHRSAEASCCVLNGQITALKSSLMLPSSANMTSGENSPGPNTTRQKPENVRSKSRASS